MTNEELVALVQTAAGKPLKVAGDTGSAEGHNILDLARAIRELPSRRPAAPWHPRKMIPPGAP